VLSLPPIFAYKLLFPIAVFWVPVVLLNKALRPTATPLPVVLQYNALLPTATLLDAALYLRAPLPTAIFPVPTELINKA